MSERCDTSPHVSGADATREAEPPRSILTLCSYCKKIRDTGNYWQQVERYASAHSDAEFSHGICPDCLEGVVRPQLRAAKGRALVLS